MPTTTYHPSDKALKLVVDLLKANGQKQRAARLAEGKDFHLVHNRLMLQAADAGISYHMIALTDEQAVQAIANRLSLAVYGTDFKALEPVKQKPLLERGLDAWAAVLNMPVLGEQG